MTYAIVIKPMAALKKEASFCSESEDEVVYGMKVLILCRCNEWYRIRTHYRYEGFIHSSNLLFDTRKIEIWNRCIKQLILKNYADILSEPKYQGNILISLPKSSQAAIISDDETDGFTCVQLADGVRGYIRSDFLCSSNNAGYEDCYYRMHLENKISVLNYVNQCLNKSEEEFRNGLISEALTYLGTQYRWGGRTPLGIDCSGLCFTVYMLNGLIIYRDSKIKEGFPVHEISRGDLKTGDLLYFPGHIAMYMGNNKYIHSTGRKGSSGVVINSLNPDDSDYRQDLVEKLYAAGSVFH